MCSLLKSHCTALLNFFIQNFYEQCCNLCFHSLLRLKILVIDLKVASKFLAKFLEIWDHLI
jgi:hypothetical protein